MAGSWGIFSPAHYAGVDQGVDFTGAGPVPALDQATITDVGRSSIVEGGTYPYVIYRLDAGPYKGHFVYLAENFTPQVRPGQKVKQGQSVGRAKGSYPYIEIGFNKTPQGWNAVAPLGGATAAGQAIKSYIYGLIGTAPPVTIPAGGTATGGGGGGIVSHIPVVGGIVSGTEATAHLFGKLLDPRFWLRALEVVGGFLLVLLGLYLLTRQVGLADVPEPGLVGGLPDQAAAELQFSPGRAAYRGPRRKPTRRHEATERGQRQQEIRRRSELAQPSDEIPF